jgi:hypothetical protein
MKSTPLAVTVAIFWAITAFSVRSTFRGPLQTTYSPKRISKRPPDFRQNWFLKRLQTTEKEMTP